LEMAASERKRVVVTGLGVISGCGVTHDTFFESCLEGKSSLGTVTRFDASAYPCSIASEVPLSLFDPSDYYTNPKNMKTNDRFTHFAVAAARNALKDAGVGDTPETLPNPDRVGVMVGTAFGGVETFETETLKLAQKPDRPKVRNSCAKKLDKFSVSIESLSSNLDLGLSFHYPSTFGKYCIGCHWN